MNYGNIRELNGGYIYDTNEKLSDLGVKKSSVKLFKKDTILFSFKLSIGKTAIVGNPLYTNEAIAGINSKYKDVLDNKYLYYYLSLKDFSNKGSGILGNGSMNKKSLAEIKISILPLEKQKEIVEYCEYNQNLISQLEKEIEQNKKKAEEFMNALIKNIKNNFDEDVLDDININEEHIEKKDDSEKDEIIKKIVKVNKNKKVIKKIDIESDFSLSSDDEEYKWTDDILNKIKKYKDDEEKLKSIRRKENIPKDIFNKKLKEINN